MINLRFHVVSLIAVFLALAIGIATGATVVDRGLVRLQEQRLDNLQNRLDDRDGELSSLAATLDEWERFGSQSEDRLAEGRLLGVPVVVVAMKGVEEAPVRALVEQLGVARAAGAGQLWVTSRAALTDPDDLTAARAALGAASTRPETIRYLLHRRVADALLTPASTGSLDGLRRAGFLEYRGGTSSAIPVLPDGVRVVVVSGTGAVLPDDAFLLPLLGDLAGAESPRVVAVETPSDRASGAEGTPTNPFLAAVRGSRKLSARLSSVDDLDSLAGRVAAVLALEDLSIPLTGHYGRDRGASRLLPAPTG